MWKKLWWALGVLFAVNLASCAPGGKVAPVKGASDVRTRKTPPAQGERLGPIRVVHGNGCYPVGQRGTAPGVETLLRNKAVEMGANYVQITNMILPQTNVLPCSSNEYIVEGIAYRVGDTATPALVIPSATGSADGTPASAVPAVARGASPAASAGGFTSACAGSEGPSPEGTLLAGEGSCLHQFEKSPPTAERTFAFSARHLGGAGWAVWFGGTPPSGLLFVYEGGSLSLSGGATLAGAGPPKLALAGWHDWVFTFTGQRLVVRLDGKVLLVADATLAPGDLGIWTRGNGRLEVRRVVARSAAPQEARESAALAVGWLPVVLPAGGGGGTGAGAVVVGASTGSTWGDRDWVEVAAFLPKAVGQWRWNESMGVVPSPWVSSSYLDSLGNLVASVDIEVGPEKADGRFEANDKIDGLPARITSDGISRVTVRYSPTVRIIVSSYRLDVKSFATALGVRRIGRGIDGVVVRHARATKPAAAAASAPANPSRMAGKCNVDSIDWLNRAYPASPRIKQGFTLVKGQHRLADRNLRFAGVVPAELDGQAPPEVVVTIEHGSLGAWTGNSVPPPDPDTKYAFRLSDSCEPQVIGSVEFDAWDTLRFENDALLRIRGSNGQFTVDEWRVSGSAFKLTSSRKAGREALDDPLPPCDEARSLATLASFIGRPGGELLRADPCVMKKLRTRLGKNRQKFDEYTSMSMSPLELRDGYLVSDGCMVHMCGYRRAAFSVKLDTGVVEAVIVDIGKKLTIERSQWLTESGRPLPPLRATIEESNEGAKSLFN